jgi:tyrosyl-tRNA synthetase
MWRYYELLSFKPKDEVAALRAGHPKDAKVALAKELITRFHSAAAADHEVEQFKQLFGKEHKNDIPADAPTVRIESDGKPAPLVRILVEAALVPSNSEARRQIAQNAVSINGERVNDAKHELHIGTHAVRVGKTRWATIVVG